MIVTPIIVFCNCSMFCCALLCVHSSFAIIMIAVEKTNDMPHKCTLLECDTILEDGNLYWSLLCVPVNQFATNYSCSEYIYIYIYTNIIYQLYAHQFGP